MERFVIIQRYTNEFVGQGDWSSRRPLVEKIKEARLFSEEAAKNWLRHSTFYFHVVFDKKTSKPLPISQWPVPKLPPVGKRLPWSTREDKPNCAMYDKPRIPGLIKRKAKSSDFQIKKVTVTIKLAKDELRDF